VFQGLKVLAPWNVEDVKRPYLRHPSEITIQLYSLENEMMYGITFDAPDHVAMDKDFRYLPLNKAKVRKNWH